MSLFKKKPEYPKLPAGNYEIVLRCSICNGEQIICMQDKTSGELRELYLVTDKEDLEGFCKANSITSDSIKRVY